MLGATMRLPSLAVLALAVACHNTETLTSAPSTALPTATTPAALTSSSAAPSADAPAARADNRWTTPVDCAARDASADKNLPPEDRQRDRLNCELTEELRAFVAERQACASSAECTNVGGSCPFGCTIPVAQSHANEVTQKLASLVERQEKAGTRCAYRCIAGEPPACVAGRCTGK